MAETPETNKLDFRNGLPIRDLRDGINDIGPGRRRRISSEPPQ